MDAPREKKSIGGKLLKHLSARGDIPMVNKKSSKPVTEKRRRDKINKCLVQLKNIVMRATGKDEKRFAKMEKVDILEMTIGHLIEMHQRNIDVTRRLLFAYLDGTPEMGPHVLYSCRERFVDHWGIATPVHGHPLDPFGRMRGNNAMETLQQGHTNQNFYPGQLFPSSAYKCGYSGEKAIMGVNFNADDVMESGSVMCGSESRVFVFAEDNSAERSGKSTEYPSLRRHEFSKEWNRYLFTEEPLMTSTPVEASAAKPVRSSTSHGLTSLPKGFLSPEEMPILGGHGINSNTSPKVRVRLFTSSETSSDESLERKSYSTASATGSSSAGSSGGSDGEGGLWRPW